MKRIETRERFDNLLRAAKRQSDFEMEGVISANDFLERAMYHSTCMTNYLFKREKDQNAEDIDLNHHDVAFAKLISSIHDDLTIHKKAFSLKFLLDKFCTFLLPDLSGKYTSQKLQRRLEKHYGSNIAIQTGVGQGITNILFSSSITVCEAIQAARNLKEELRLKDFEYSFELPELK